MKIIKKAGCVNSWY